MQTARRLSISNPGIGGSGYLTTAAMEADAGMFAGYETVMHVCRGLAQAGGPLCVDVIIKEDEIYGVAPLGVDYINSSDLTEAWRTLTSPKNFNDAFPRGVTVVSDYYVEVAILVAASIKGPRYYNREEFLKKFQELIDQGKNLRVVAYDFSHFKFPAIMRGPFSIGLLIADLEGRQEEGLLKVSKEDAVKGILLNVPTKGGVVAVSQRRKFNEHIFNCGYNARREYYGPEDQRIIMIP